VGIAHKNIGDEEREEMRGEEQALIADDREEQKGAGKGNDDGEEGRILFFAFLETEQADDHDQEIEHEIDESPAVIDLEDAIL